MKKSSIFKLLIDVVYYYFFIEIIVLLIISPLMYFLNGGFKIRFNGIETNINSLTFAHWTILFFGSISFILFFKGLYHLRLVARFLLSKNFFSLKTIQNLNTSGKYFLYASILYFIILLLLSILKIFKGNIYMGFNITTTLPIFTAIIGLFFMLQSSALQIAKVYKDDSALTI